MSSTILVVGATGNVGHYLVEMLLEKGISVRAATRTPDNYQLTGATPIFFDYDQSQTYHTALEGVNRVFFIAKNGDVEPQDTLIPFIDAAVEMGVEHMVLMTAFGVDQAEGTGLRAVEEYLMNANVAHTIMRPNWFMENFSTGFILPMIQQGGIFLPAGEAATSLIAARDIASVAATVLTETVHRNQAYALTGGEALTYHEAATLISKATGRTITYVPIPDDTLRQSLLSVGWYPQQADFMVSLFQGVQQGWNAAVLPTVEQITGQPPIPLTQFIEENATVWQQPAESGN